MSAGKPLQISHQLPRSMPEPKILSRKHERDSGEPTQSQKDGNVQESRKHSKQSRTRSSGFPCPFAKHDPEKYGGDNGCINYSRSIVTVLRHHVLGKHRKEHEEAGAGKEGLFNEVKELARKASSSKEKETKGWEVKLWKSMYKVLFEVESSEEDNIPEPTLKSSAQEVNVNNRHAQLAERVTTNPLVVIQAEKLIESIEILQRERRLARQAIHRKSDEEVALIRNRETAEVKSVEARLDELIRTKHSELEALLTWGSGPHTRLDTSEPSISTFEVESGFDHFAPPPMQTPDLQDNALWSSHFAAPACPYQPQPIYSMIHDNSIASASESAYQAPSDEGYQSRLDYCEHRASVDDPPCNACTPLFGSI